MTAAGNGHTPKGQNKGPSVFTMHASSSGVDLGAFLDNEVWPRLTPDSVFTHEAHNWQKAEAKWQGGCPWHTSKSGTAFYIDVATLRWRCPACRIGGGPVQYLHKLSGGAGVSPRGSAFVDIVRRLADIAVVKFPESPASPEQQEVARKREARRAVLDSAIMLCQEWYWSSHGDHARAYMLQRGFTEDECRELALGLYPETLKLGQQLEKQGHAVEDVLASGVLFEPMVGYVTFPWHEDNGTPLTIYGKWPGPGAAPRNKKTMALGNPKDASKQVWERTKRVPLYLNRALRAGHRDFVIVEGPTDAALPQLRGDTRVMACVAAELSGGQVETLVRRKARSVTIALDPDAGGDGGVLSCIRQLAAVSIVPYVAPRFPDGLDPDDFFLRVGIDGWLAHIAQAVHGFRYVAQGLVARYSAAGLGDPQKDALLAEAVDYHLQAPGGAAEELVRHFWPTIIEATGADMALLRKRLGLPHVAPDQPHDPDGDDAPKQDWIAVILQQAQTSPASALETALKPEAVAEWVRLRTERPEVLEAFFQKLLQAGAKSRDVIGLRQAVNQAHKLHKQQEKLRQAAAATAAMAAKGVNALAGLRNYREEWVNNGNGQQLVKFGMPIQAVAARVHELTEGWPCRVGSLLFAVSPDHKPVYLDRPAALFAWISRYLHPEGGNRLVWGQADDMVSEGRFHAYLTQNVQNYESVEAYPHWPAMAGTYYCHPPLPECDGSVLRALLDFFCVETDIDRDLILAAILTMFWGGPLGKRPVFLFTSEDEKDSQKGRGSGKSTAAMLLASIPGGYLEAMQSEKVAELKTRLLSAEGIDKRTVLLDNVKTLRFSQAELEGLITTATISGRRLFAGEGRRPNALTWFLTINGASLSKDMAQRCVVVKVKRPGYSSGWQQRVEAFIEANRWQIIADAVWFLQQPAQALRQNSRWAAWEEDVLSKLPEPSEAQHIIRERQKDADDDAAEEDSLRDSLWDELKRRGHNPADEVIRIKSAELASILSAVEKRPFSPKGATSFVRHMTIPELTKDDHRTDEGGRGWLWAGAKRTPDTKQQPLKPLPDSETRFNGAGSWRSRS